MTHPTLVQVCWCFIHLSLQTPNVCFFAQLFFKNMIYILRAVLGHGDSGTSWEHVDRRVCHRALREAWARLKDPRMLGLLSVREYESTRWVEEAGATTCLQK